LLSLHHICFNDITFTVRTQIQLTDEQYTRLKELSLRSHKSLAEMIRVAVDRLLMTEQPDRAALYRQAETVVGKYSAPAVDISVEHDRYLDDAFSS
jgi:Ribbon-helix-helix protein, copG family